MDTLSDKPITLNEEKGPPTSYFLPPADLSVHGSTSPTPVGPDTEEFLAATGQGLARDAANFGASIGQAAANVVSPKLGYAAAEAGEGLPTDNAWWSQFLFGKDPIKTLPNTAAEYETQIRSSDFAKKYGIDKYATPLAVLGSTIPPSLDFLGVGGEKNAIEALARAASIEDVARIGRKMGIHEDLLLPWAEHVAGTTDKTEIANSIKSIEAMQATTHAAPPIEHSVEREAPAAEKQAGIKTTESATAITKTTEGAEKVINGSADELPRKPVLPAREAPKAAPRPVSEVERDLAEWKTQAEILDDVAKDHPGRALMKFRSNTSGELPEVTGTKTMKSLTGNGKTVNRSAFGQRGDTILQDLLGQNESGGGDVAIAQSHLDAYQTIRAQQEAARGQVKQLKEELSAAKAADKARASARTSAPAPSRESSRTEFPARGPGDQTPGDYLRRGAERASEKPKPAPANVARGTASTGAQRNAALETVAGGIESGPFKGFSERMKNWFQDWVFHRQAAEVDTKVALRRLEVLKDMDPPHFKAWLVDYLGKNVKDGAIVEGARVRKGMFGLVEDTLNRWLDEEQAAGIKVADKDNYLPIYLKDKAGEMTEGMEGLDGRRVGLKPGFAMRSQFPDYIEAFAAGYEPKYTSVYDILAARGRAHFKAMADAELFHQGVREGWIVPETAVDPELRGDFRDLDSERFPKQQAMYGNTIYRGVYSAPAALAEKINNYLASPNKFLQALSSIAGTLKSAALSVGIPNIGGRFLEKNLGFSFPGSGLSVHWYNVLPREIAADFAISARSAPLEIAKYVYYGINPKAAANYIEKNLDKALPLIRAGMKIGVEDTELRVLDLPDDAIGKIGAAGKKAADWLHNLFGHGVFARVLPARKIANGIRLQQSYIKAGYTADQAARQAAEDVNTIYGGINWEALGRSRNWQAFWRSAVLAPDYAETNIKQGARIIKSFLNPKSIPGRLYRGMMAAYAGSYLIANLINHEYSGHWMWQNDIMHQFSIDVGKDKETGKRKYLNIYGTGVEFLRIPLYTATAIAKGNLDALHTIILNRLSIPFASVGSLVMNVDWKGDPIVGADSYGNPQTAIQQGENIIANTVGRALPGSLEELPNLLQGKTPAAISIPKALGFPITEKSTAPSSADIKVLETQAAKDIRKGDYRLFNKLVKAGAISPRTRARFIRAALSGPTAKQIAASAATKKKNKQVQQNLDDMGL